MLSTCETAVERIEHGNGVAGLTRAFHLARAEAVASTQWHVPDFDTAKLMDQFLGHLASVADKAEALRQALLKRIEPCATRHGAAHPNFWAGFTISGR